ncbi:restriction endonuclease subunit S [Vibrio cholerae]|nr:restriction endonuclease subunit S [Vibrio cholerae]
MSQLPKGWLTSTIGEACLIENGLRKPISLKERANCQGEFPYYGATGVIDYLNSYTHEGEYVLIGEDGANLLSKSKPLAFIANGKYWVNNHAHTLRCLGGSPNLYLEKYFNSLSLESWVTGSAQPKLTKKNLESIPFPLAPLAEQIRIVEKLDEVLAQVDTIKARLDGIPAILKRFRQSVLAAAVSGRLTEDFRTQRLSEKVNPILSLQPNAKTRRGVPDNVLLDEDLLNQEIPNQWVVESVAHLLKLAVIRDIKDGNHGANHPKSAEFVDDGVPFITAAQMSDKGHIDFEGAPKLTGEPLSKIKVGFAESQDVIYSHKGTVGRVSVIDRACVLSPQTTYYRLNQAFVLPRYLAVYLQSQQYKNQVNKVKTQTTRDFVSISAQYQMTLLVPLIEEQKEIVRLVDQYFAFADTIEAQVKKAQARVDKLTQSILAKAFRGELVPQDPNDEPADKLLERIALARKEAEVLAKAAKKAAKK